MQVSIYKNTSNLYELTPLEGPFAGRKIALAEGVIMRDGTYRAGRLRSVWGFTALTDRVFEHAQTIQSLLGVR